MAAELIRRYNRSPEQLALAAAEALAAQFPGRPVGEDDGSLIVRTGPHKPWTSLGEQVEVSLLKPGVIKLRSVNRPRLPLIFEHGDNLANVEDLARALDEACRTRPASCANCGAALEREPVEDEQLACPACGKKLFRPQLPVPRSAQPTRTAAIALLLVFTLPALILLAVVAVVLLSQ